jgi:hypothetical protein
MQLCGNLRRNGWRTGAELEAAAARSTTVGDEQMSGEGSEPADPRVGRLTRTPRTTTRTCSARPARGAVDPQPSETGGDPVSSLPTSRPVDPGTGRAGYLATDRARMRTGRTPHASRRPTRAGKWTCTERPKPRVRASVTRVRRLTHDGRLGGDRATMRGSGAARSRSCAVVSARGPAHRWARRSDVPSASRVCKST